MFYALNLHNACQSHLSKAGKNVYFILHQFYLNKAAQKVKARKRQIYVWDGIY